MMCRPSWAPVARWRSALLVLAFSITACGSGEPDRATERDTPASAREGPVRPAGGAERVAPAPPAADSRPRLVVLGDSLTAGLGLDIQDAYPTLLQQKLDAAGIGLRIVNAGVSGDTSAGGLSRVDLALDGDVRLMLVALGGNDALRALPVSELERNLAGVIERAQQRGVTVVLAGMEAPPNFGRDYVVSFRGVYTTLATRYRVTLIPFLLDGVAGVERLNQSDGIHPTAEGARMIADHVWPVLLPIAREAVTRPAPTRTEVGRG